MKDELFEKEKIANGLSPNWEKLEDQYYFSSCWWESWRVVKIEDYWVIWQYDHDAGVDDNGQSTTSFEEWDTPFKTWIEAAKEIEHKY